MAGAIGEEKDLIIASSGERLVAKRDRLHVKILTKGSW